jgi:hypothetical protein
LYRYWASKNAWSMDGLPGTHNGQATMKAEKITPLKKMVGPMAPTRYGYPNAKFGIEHLLLVAVVSVVSTYLLLLYGAQIASALVAGVPEDANSVFMESIGKLR